MDTLSPVVFSSIGPSFQGGKREVSDDFSELREHIAELSMGVGGSGGRVIFSCLVSLRITWAT